uniref:hypothetical protein n=1 Tax=Burkholderia arboris TaxID=488730 RepID=UPI003BEF1DDB
MDEKLASSDLIGYSESAPSPADERAVVREIRRLADEHINTPKLSMELLAIANELAGGSSGPQSSIDDLLRMLLTHAWKVDVKRLPGGNGIRRIVLDLRDGTTMAPWAVDEVIQQVREFCEGATGFHPSATRSGDSR